MKSRPPALDLSLSGVQLQQGQALQSDTSKTVTEVELDTKSPPLPTPPMFKKGKDDDFQRDLEKALGRVGNSAATSPRDEKRVIELSIPVGLQ
jgi:hypothetical protein